MTWIMTEHVFDKHSKVFTTCDRSTISFLASYGASLPAMTLKNAVVQERPALEDCQIAAWNYDIEQRRLFIHVVHPSFPEVPDGEALPVEPLVKPPLPADIRGHSHQGSGGCMYLSAEAVGGLSVSAYFAEHYPARRLTGLRWADECKSWLVSYEDGPLDIVARIVCTSCGGHGHSVSECRSAVQKPAAFSIGSVTLKPDEPYAEPLTSQTYTVHGGPQRIDPEESAGILAKDGKLLVHIDEDGPEWPPCTCPDVVNTGCVCGAMEREREAKG